MKLIKHNNKLLAILLSNKIETNKVDFPTSPQNTLQLGIMKYSKGRELVPHVHKPTYREIQDTQEFIHIDSGKVQIDLYDEGKKPIHMEVLETGDSILLISGGHGFKFLEESTIIEIKQGPYTGVADDKTKFEEKQ